MDREQLWALVNREMANGLWPSEIVEKHQLDDAKVRAAWRASIKSDSPVMAVKLERQSGDIWVPMTPRHMLFNYCARTMLIGEQVEFRHVNVADSTKQVIRIRRTA